MRLKTLAVLLSAAAISAAPVPKLQASVPVPDDLLPPVGSLAVFNVIDSLIDTLKDALPAKFAKQLKTALGSTLGPVERIPMVGAVVASLLGDDSIEGSWNATELDAVQDYVVARLATVHARPTPLAVAAVSAATPTNASAETSATAPSSSPHPLHKSLPESVPGSEDSSSPSCVLLRPDDPLYPHPDYGQSWCAPISTYNPNTPPTVPVPV